jgi:hypothetical protein
MDKFSYYFIMLKEFELSNMSQPDILAFKLLS